MLESSRKLLMQLKLQELKFWKEKPQSPGLTLSLPSPWRTLLVLGTDRKLTIQAFSLWRAQKNRQSILRRIEGLQAHFRLSPGAGAKTLTERF